MGFINTIYCGLLEYFYFFKFVKQKQHTSIETVEDYKLNAFLEEKLKTRAFKRVISIGCPCKINSDLMNKYSINIYNLHGGIIPFQKGRFSPIKSLNKGHQYLGASLYLISDKFDEGSLISQDYFIIKNSNLIENYNRVLKLSSSLLASFLSNERKIIPIEILEKLRECNRRIDNK